MTARNLAPQGSGMEMTTTEVSLALGLSATRVRALAETGALSARRTPLGRLFDRASVLAYKARREERP